MSGVVNRKSVVAIAALIAVAALTNSVIAAETASAAGAAGEPQAGAWLTSYDKALEQAKSQGKYVLAAFTGSDWCPWCQQLKKDVFDTQAFKDWAAKNIVLLSVDFPRKKELSPEDKDANSSLAQKYAVTGYPTVLFLNPSGKIAGSIEGCRTLPMWLEDANKILASAPKLKTADTTAAAADSDEGAGKLVEGLKAASDGNLPILIVMAKAGDDAAKALADALLANADIVAMAGKEMVVVQLDTPVRSASGRREVDAYQRLADEFGIKSKVDYQCVVLDAKATKSFLKSEGKCDPGWVISAVKRAAKSAQPPGTAAPADQASTGG
jgi:thiol-disulfide isomerase/thioredoxin